MHKSGLTYGIGRRELFTDEFHFTLTAENVSIDYEVIDIMKFVLMQSAYFWMIIHGLC